MGGGIAVAQMAGEQQMIPTGERVVILTRGMPGQPPGPDGLLGIGVSFVPASDGQRHVVISVAEKGSAFSSGKARPPPSVTRVPWVPFAGDVQPAGAIVHWGCRPEVSLALAGSGVFSTQANVLRRFAAGRASPRGRDTWGCGVRRCSLET